MGYSPAWFSKMVETNQPMPLFIPEPESQGFEAGKERDRRHELRFRLHVHRSSNPEFDRFAIAFSPEHNKRISRRVLWGEHPIDGYPSP
jgi:hypothetical protein